jgi:excisionase family DNA binding protein
MTDAKYVPIETVAEYFSVSVSTIRAWVRQNRIPQHTYIRVGNSEKPTYRFCISDITEALTHRDKALEEVGEEPVPVPVLVSSDEATTREMGQVINFDSLDEDQ